MARHRRVFCSLAALAWLLTAAPARAYEDQASIDAALGYALVVDSVHLPRQGAALDLGAALGISDVGVVRALAGYAAFSERPELAHVGRFRVEALYLIDVLQFVPFVGLGAGLLVSGGNNRLEYFPAGHLVFGADYLWSRIWTLGVDIRSGVLIEGGEVRSTSDISLRLSRMFELF